MQQAGFESVDFQTMTGGIACLHWGTKPATARAQAPAPRA